MVGSALNALTMSKRFSVSTEPSNRKYVTLFRLPHKSNTHSSFSYRTKSKLPKKTCTEERVMRQKVCTPSYAFETGPFQ